MGKTRTTAPLMLLRVRTDSAARTGGADGGVYADLYAQGAVNPYAQSNYIRVSAEAATDTHDRLAGGSTGYVGDGTAPNPTGSSGYVDDSSRYDQWCAGVLLSAVTSCGNNRCKCACFTLRYAHSTIQYIYYCQRRVGGVCAAQLQPTMLAFHVAPPLVLDIAADG